MSSNPIIVPALLAGDAAAVQHQADLISYNERTVVPEKLYLYFGAVNALGFYNQVTVPLKKGAVLRVRMYAAVAGTGSFTADVLYIDSGGTSHSLFAAPADYLVSQVANPNLVEVPTTATNVIVDPYDTSRGRLYVNFTALAGTAWAGVTFELLVYPISQ